MSIILYLVKFGRLLKKMLFKVFFVDITGFNAKDEKHRTCVLDSQTVDKLAVSLLHHHFK